MHGSQEHDYLIGHDLHLVRGKRKDVRSPEDGNPRKLKLGWIRQIDSRQAKL